MDWVKPEEVRTLFLHYPELDGWAIERARETVDGLPPLSRSQWERIARRLGLVVTGDGVEPIGIEPAASLGDPNSGKDVP
jgi:hypothetical protein